MHNRGSNIKRGVAGFLSLALAYFALAVLGLHWATVSTAASPVFPAAGVALAGLLLGGLRLWPAILVGRLAAALVMGSQLPLWADGVIAGGNALAALAGAAALRWYGLDLALIRLRSIWALVIAAVGSAAMSAGVGAGVLAIVHGHAFEQVTLTWLNWWAGTLTGTLLITPLLLCWTRGEPISRSRGWWTQLLLSMLVTAAGTVLIFTQLDPTLLRVFLLFPLLMWAALACGVRGSTAAMVPVSAIAVWGTTVGLGPFAHEPLPFVLLQQFITVGLLSTIVLAVIADERRGREALQASEERYRLVSRATNDVIWDWNVATDEVLWNEGLEVVFGYPRAQVRHRLAWWHDHIHPEDRERVRHGIQRVVDESGEMWRDEYRFRRSDGSYASVLDRGYIHRDVKGRPLRMIGSMLDLTERHRAEAALRESEATLSAVLDALPMGVMIADPAGRIIRDNAAHRELWGIPADESPAQHDWVGYWPNTGEQIKTGEWAMDRALRRGEVVQGELVEGVQFSTGQRRSYLTSAAPVRDAKGAIVAGVIVELDVTEQLRIQNALRESETLTRTIAETSTQGLAVMDERGHCTYANPAWLAMTGYAAEEIRSRPLHDLVHHHYPDGRPFPREECPIDRALPENIDLRAHEDVFFRKDGSNFPVLCSASPIFRNGQSSLTVIEIRDMTQAKRAEAEREQLLERERAARIEAEHASEAKSQFLATLSHELRTPLTPVLLTISLMESHPSLPPDLRQDVETIRRNVELESRLISDLLDLTRITNGKLLMDMQHVDLHLIVRAAIDICQREASAKLNVDLSAVRHTVRGDSTRLQQVFWNLINNAIKFTPPDGTISICSIDDPDGRIRVEVIDTGKGIDPSVLPRLFNAFEQGDVRINRQHAGLGLGLVISRRLVEAHGGTISASSVGRGRGATFTVTLPTVQQAFMPDTTQSMAPGPAARHPISVLLVEDHEPTLMVMTRLLRKLGHQVHGVSTVASASTAARRHEYHLIISDLGLPDGSGLDLMRELKQLYSGRAIALTGYGMESDIIASREAGFAEHLTKPVDLASLEAAIDRLTTQQGDSSEPALFADGAVGS